jgi:hypothetical protein
MGRKESGGNVSDGIRSMSAEAYFAADGLSRSMTEDIIPPLNTPLHFWAKHIAKIAPAEETPAMRLGSLTHRFILESDTTEGAFHIKPAGMNFATREGKEWKASRSHLPILTSDEAAAIEGMRAAVWKHKVARKFIEGAQTEKCLFAQDGKGTLRKARLDLIPPSGNTLADLKTCLTAEPDEMSKTMDKLGYNRQAAFTLALCELLGMPFERWVLICVEKTPPFDVVCYPVDELAVRIGRREIEGAIQTYRHCVETGEWPGRCAGVSDELTLPRWRQKELDAA